MLDADHRGDIDDGSIDSLERIYNEAVCAGGALSRPADEERLHSALELLAQTPPAPATSGSPRSTPSFTTARCDTPSTPP